MKKARIQSEFFLGGFLFAEAVGRKRWRDMVARVGKRDSIHTET